jgi:ParB family chromosome partitioning protein
MLHTREKRNGFKVVMAAKHIGLGRGLGALIKDVPAEAPPPPPSSGGIQQVPVEQVHKSPWQPRHTMSTESLEDLTHSVRERGVIQPLLVRRVEDHYELIAGERRLRAAQAAELKQVPVIITDVSDREALELALIENLQREDLNLIEEAEGYRTLSDKFDMTQEQIAQRVGKARATVANALRLLELPDPVKQLLAENRLSAGHAKVLLGLPSAQEQELLAVRCVKEDLSVRALETAVEKARQTIRKRRPAKSDVPENHLHYLAERLHEHLGTTVRITPCRTLANGKKVKGAIEIDYFSSDDLDRLLVVLGVADDL